MSQVEHFVLVVADSPLVRDRLLAAIRGRGLTAEGVGTPQEVLRFIDQREASAMVLFNDLPLGSGYELAQQVRQHQLGDDLAMVLITESHWSAQQKAIAIQELSLIDVLSEPADPARIAALLHAELLGPGPDAPSEHRLVDKQSLVERREVEAAAEALSGQAVELRGSLRDTAFPALLHQLYRREESGAVYLLRDTVKKIVYIRDGQPTFVKSNLLAECLGNVLVREKLITQQECEASLERMRASRRQQGTVLIEMGCISPQNLVFALELQLSTKLFDIFSWESGEFLFKSDVRSPTETVSLEMSNAALIAEGVRRKWNTPRLEAALKPVMGCYLLPSAIPELRFQHLPLDDMEQSFVDSLDGRTPLRELIARSPVSSRRAMALAYVLLVTGVAEVRSEACGLGSPVVGQDDARVRAELASELMALREKDAHGVLRVAEGARPSEVEQAYSRCARQYHPDRFRARSPDTRRLAREIFGVLVSAYRELMGARAERVPSKEIVFEEPPPMPFSQQSPSVKRPKVEPTDAADVGQRSVMASKQAERAQHLMRQKRWSDAHQELLEAVDLLGEAGDLRAMLGWVTFQLNPENPARLREGIRQLRRALELDPGQDRAYLYLGHIYAAIGRSILAEKHFERAVQCNPHCSEALEQLKLHQKQRFARRGGSGLGKS